jgi:hypothetical protein
MKRAHLLGLLVVAVLALTPLVVLAQDDMEFEEYTSEDETLTLSYPKDWFIEEAGAEVGTPGIMIANSEETLAKISGEDDIAIESGEVAMMVLLFPGDLLGFLGITLTDDTTPVELADTIVRVFMEPETPVDAEETPEAVEIGEAEELELDEDRTAGYVEVADNETEGAFIIFELKDGIVLISYVATAPGEFEQEYADQLKVVAGSVEYTGTAEELMAAIMGGAMEDEEPMTTTLDGATLVDERCTTCHTADRIMQADKDETGWTATVDRMIGYGAQLNDEERTALIDYLVATY